MTDLYTSLMRTVVPILAGLVLTLAADIGLDLDSAEVTAAVTAAMTAAYYTAFRLLEEWAGRIGVPWLRTLAGVLLGWATPPDYSAAEEARIELRFDTAAADREIRAALDRAYGRRRAGS